MEIYKENPLRFALTTFAQGLILVHCGKGTKDRLAVLGTDLSKQLQAYRQTQRSTQQYVFEGKTMGKPIAPKTIQWGFVKAREKAELPNWVTAHVKTFVCDSVD